MTTIRQALALAADHHRRGDVANAEGILRLLLAVHPDNAIVLHSLSRIVPQEEAIGLFLRVLTSDTDCVPALCSLGGLYAMADRHEDAAACFRHALAIDPGLIFANMNLAGILEMAGRLQEAAPYRARVPRPQPLVIAPAAEPRRTVLLLTNLGNGNVPLGALLPPQTNTCITWYVEYATTGQADNLPPFDVAFNAIGNPDVMDEAAETVAAFHAHTPVLNPPAAVARTRRDRLPALLQGIPGILVPAVARLSREEMADGRMAGPLDAAGVTWPVLVRPIVGHGGQGVVLAASPDELAQVEYAADAYYVAAYHDCRGADGYCRKYRMIFVDRQPYAYHLAISEHWLVHYFSADMMAAPWKREEERRFLEAPVAVLGAPAMAAIAAIGKRIDLDFGGIDFALLTDGRVLVFEANATMLVHLRENIEDFPGKHVAVPAIVQAFDAMLDRQARPG